MTDAPIAGWYPDPKNSAAQWRWWNGSDWTADTAPRPDAPVVRPADWGWASAPVPTKAASPAPVRTDPARLNTAASNATAPSASPNTPWIWVLAFSIYIFGAIVGVLQAVAGVALLGRDNTTNLLVGAICFVVGLIPLVVFADLDGRELRKRGFPAPSALWVIVLAPLVYFAVRARKLKRVGALSKGPERALLIVVAVQILAGIAAAVLAYSMYTVFNPGSPAIG